jgi:hypothetical protein
MINAWYQRFLHLFLMGVDAAADLVTITITDNPLSTGEDDQCLVTKISAFIFDGS